MLSECQCVNKVTQKTSRSWVEDPDEGFCKISHCISGLSKQRFQIQQLPVKTWPSSLHIYCVHSGQNIQVGSWQRWMNYMRKIFKCFKLSVGYFYMQIVKIPNVAFQLIVLCFNVTFNEGLTTKRISQTLESRPPSSWNKQCFLFFALVASEATWRWLPGTRQIKKD